ncbi:MAG: hypothetical protein OYH76_21185 [Defluviicoccus sp.]|nr:hypothetical protein [Defluviicoccus sp.]
MRRALLAALALAAAPLLAVLLTTGPAAAQTTPTPNADGSYPVTGDWALTPSAVPGGGKFRLLFITDNWHNATDTSISRYDTHVRYWAASGHSAIRPYASLFKAVGSTATVDARDHVGATGTGVPIYWLGGAKVADDYGDFWDGSWDANQSSDRRNRLGQASDAGTQTDWPWTGTKNDGTRSAHPLGSSTPTRGAFGSNSPIEHQTGALRSQQHAFYALSPVFVGGTTVTIRPGSRVTEGGAATFTVSALPAPTSNLTVNLRVADAPGADFVAGADEGNQTVTIAANQRSASYEVPTVDDDTDEPASPVTVTLRSGTGYRVGAPSSARVQVRDDDPTKVSFGTGAVTFGEGTGIASVPLGLTLARWDRATFVTVSVSAGTATGADFTLVDDTVVFERGETRAVAQFLIEDDSRNESPETFTARIASASGVSVGAPRSVEVTIEDNDGPAVRFSRARYDAREGDAAQVTLSLSPSRNAPTTVGLAYADGTAKGGDWSAGPASVTIAAGAASHTFSVPTTEDPTDEPNETFRVSIASVSAGVDRGSPATATVTIVDDDLPRAVLVEASGETHDRPEGSSLSFDVVLSYFPLQPFERLTVPLTLGGTATRGADYTLRCPTVAGLTCRNLASGNPSFVLDGARLTERNPTVLELDVVKDDKAESRKTVDLTVNGRTLTHGLVDAPAASVISFFSNAFVSNENNCFFQAAMTITPPAGRDIPLRFTLGGTATEGRDFYFGGDPVLKAGYQRDSFDILCVYDDLVEPDETIVLTLDASALPNGVTVGAIPTMTLTIRDDESRDHVMTVEAVAAEVAEGEPARFRLRSTKPAPAGGMSFAVTWSGSAVGKAQRAGYTIPAGTYVSPLAWPTVADNVRLGHKEVTLTLENPGRSRGHPQYFRVGDPGAATVTVRDDEATGPTPTIYWENGDSVTESQGAAHPILISTRDLPADLPVGYTLGGTATAGVDYTIAGADHTAGTGTFTVPAGTKRNANVPFPIVLVDDSVAEGPETIAVTFEDRPGYAIQSHSRTVTFTIYDDEGAATFSLTGTPRVGETLTVTRETSDPDGDGALAYSWGYSDGPASRIFAIFGASSATFTVAERWLGKYIRAVAWYTDGAGTEHRVETAPLGPIEPASTLPVLTLAGGPAVTEGTAATFTVTATPAPAEGETLLVNIGVADAPGADFLAADVEGENGFWEFAGGAATRTFTLATVPDTVDEPSGPVTVTIRPRSGNPKTYTVGDPASASVTVNDDDDTAAVPTVTVSAGSAVTEGAGAEFTVSAAPAPTADLTVHLTVADDAASDFVASTDEGAKTVVIGANQASATYTVDTEDDSTDEANGAVAVTVAASKATPADYAVGTQASASVTVNDDDPPPATPTVRLSASAYSASEGDAASLTVHIAPRRGAATALGLTCAHGTAAAGDYAACPASVTIPANAAAHTFTVQTTEDTTAEPDETFTVTLATAPAGVAIGSPATATVTITDDDAEPVVTIAPGDAVTEGTAATFTVTASRASASALPVSVTVAEAPGANFLASTDERTHTVTLAAGETSKVLTVATSPDNDDEPNGPVTATLADGTGYAPGTPATASVAVADDDPTEVTLSGTATAIVEDGGAKTLTLLLGRTLIAGEALDVPVVVGGTARNRTDYRLGGGRGVGWHTVGDPGGFLRFTGGADAVHTTTLTVTAIDDALDEGAGETVEVGLGTLDADSGTNLGGGASGTGSVTFTITDDDDPLPVVTITGGAGVTEGADATFTVTASAAPAAALDVRVDVSDAPSSDFLADAAEGRKTVTIAAGATSADLTVSTEADTTDEPDGPVRAALAAGAGYTLGDPASATVEVTDDDATVGPTLSIEDATMAEGAGEPNNRSSVARDLWGLWTYMRFTVRLSAPQPHPVRVSAQTRSSTPVSARAGFDHDYLPAFLTTRFHPGRTVAYFYVKVINDAIDENDETFELVLQDARGAAIAKAVAIGTITNDDPMPAAWLSRFGRTVAEQALDGVSERLAAPRTPGMRGTLAGLPLGFGAGDAAPAAIAPASPDPDPAVLGETRTMTMRDALLGSRFTLTGAADAAGGSAALWGRASQGRFDGRARGDGTDIGLDGEVTTGMLGADYARDGWLVGLALAQSSAKGTYAAFGGEGAAPCPDTDAVLCDGAVRAGEGKVEASLTAALPYASLDASERLTLWGAAGVGAGGVTVETAPGSEEAGAGPGGRYEADTTWRMAAAGLRGDLLAPPAEGSGLALALTSDALWARTSSEETRDLAASDSDVTRLRLGLAGSWRFALDGAGPSETEGAGLRAQGASLTPKLELGARHDGGDAETGFGLELGAGLAWSDPALGLSLDLSGRTLIAHEDGALEDRGLSAALAFDPSPETERGPSLSLRQDWGGQSAGGLDALFTPAPLEDRTGSEPAGRWALEAAFGFPAFGGRWTGSPHAGLGLATGARDYSLGWRLTPESRNTPDLSFGLHATRRESDTGAPEHALGFEARLRW